MSRLDFARRLTPLALTVALLTACTGASPGRPDSGAAQNAGQRAQDYASDPANGRLIGAVIVALAGLAFVAWLWKNPAVRIVLAMIIAGGVVYLGTKGSR